MQSGIDERLYDPSAMRGLYHGKGLTTAELAEELNCSRGSVCNYLDEYDIERRPRGNPAQENVIYELLENEAWLRNRYHGDEWFVSDIAGVANCSRALAAQYMEKFGIERRTRGFRAGEHHPKYKGEKADTYGPNWYQQRKAALERDEWTCQRCGMDEAEARDAYTKGMNVHHIRPRSEFLDDGVLDHEAANALSNLITLCHGCHKKLEGLPIDIR